MPATGRSSPVGMSVESTGVKESALMVIEWPYTAPLPSPARLKYVCCERFTGVALSVVARYSTANSSLSVSVYVTVTFRLPG